MFDEAVVVWQSGIAACHNIWAVLMLDVVSLHFRDVRVTISVMVHFFRLVSTFAKAAWAADAPQEEQGEGRFAMHSQRYDYYLHVDEDALQSVINGPAPPAHNLGNSFVNLVCRRILVGMRPEHTYGCDEKDHCWRRITYQDLMATWYNQFRPQGSWGNEYRIPPEVARP